MATKELCTLYYQQTMLFCFDTIVFIFVGRCCKICDRSVSIFGIRSCRGKRSKVIYFKRLVNFLLVTNLLFGFLCNNILEFSTMSIIYFSYFILRSHNIQN